VVCCSAQAARRVPGSSRSSYCRWCSKLCSERVDKRQIGTGCDRIAIGRFSAGNRKIGRDSRESDWVLVGLANRRLRPLGHLTAARKPSINEIGTYAPGMSLRDMSLKLSMLVLRIDAEPRQVNGSQRWKAAVLFADTMLASDWPT
jgi:hypothetical protein